jgi:hypothetical protein
VVVHESTVPFGRGDAARSNASSYLLLELRNGLRHHGSQRPLTVRHPVSIGQKLVVLTVPKMGVCPA